MEYKLIDSKSILKHLEISEIPSNIDMFYDLSYQLSTYIFDYRVRHNLTQKQFAELLGVRQPMISKLESGNYNISLQSICDVMVKLNTRIKLDLEPACEEIVSASLDKCVDKEPAVSTTNIEELGVAV